MSRVYFVERHYADNDTKQLEHEAIVEVEEGSPAYMTISSQLPRSVTGNIEAQSQTYVGPFSSVDEARGELLISEHIEVVRY